VKPNETQVLIIGIDDYKSPNLPALQGARNDAIAWYRFCLNHLHIPARNITVLASPRLTENELGPQSDDSRLRGATRAEIVQEANRLANAAQNNKPGLVTFSGHGLALGAGPDNVPAMELALCPSDVSIELPANGDIAVTGALRFSELATIFAADYCKNNIIVVFDMCYASGPEAAQPQVAGSGVQGRSRGYGLDRARQILDIGAFTNRVFLGARHWTTAYEINVGGEWRGAASYAMLTLMERWALRNENGVRYPAVSHADLLDSMRDSFDVLGVPQLPALWGDRSIDGQAVLRPGTAYSRGDTSATPNARMNERQIPVDPDVVALIEIVDQNSNPIIRVVSVGAFTPEGASVNQYTEYWFTNTTSVPTLTDLTLTVTNATTQSQIDAFTSGYTLSIPCGQVIGTSNWSTWTSGPNSAGRLFQTDDPTEEDRYMGLYLEHNNNGTLASYAWYRITLLTDGFAYEASDPPRDFTLVSGTNPNSMESGAWKYSNIIDPP
jgi:hypothetical protein